MIELSCTCFIYLCHDFIDLCLLLNFDRLMEYVLMILPHWYP